MERACSGVWQAACSVIAQVETFPEALSLPRPAADRSRASCVSICRPACQSGQAIEFRCPHGQALSASADSPLTATAARCQGGWQRHAEVSWVFTKVLLKMLAEAGFS